MGLFSPPKGGRFSNKDILVYIIPVLFEQFMIAGLRIADTYMVSAISESAVAGVSLVSKIDNFVKQVFIALAMGGSVVLSQYIGAEDKEDAQKALKGNVRIVVVLGCILTLIMVIFKTQVLNLLFGSVEADVMQSSSTYFTYTALSYPFLALYNVGSACFRAMGESKVPFVASVSMMIINLILKYIFIYHLNMDVMGAALSTLISMALTGIVLIAFLHLKRNKVCLSGLFKFDFDFSISRRILSVSLPNGIEQGMFQLGALAISGLTATLSTAAIAADALAHSIVPLLQCLGASFNSVMIVFVGQCMGAGETEHAEGYVKHILKLDYFYTFINASLLIILLKPIVSIFDVSSEAASLAVQIVIIYAGFSAFFYPSSFALPSALRGSGDTKFVMVVASASMFAFRIGAAYLFVLAFDLGVIGTWLAMGCDWIIRSTVFHIRFRKGKWKLNKVI